ncbi:unnamed protein product [Schistosoma margrebowiei]|uniref:Uncharacterized protein n=1 Tax=Schistosoma margrebowiei TaxID=48269 RepID=A0A183N994_9TREM|nr:unnamed protein product [Schistosoma margrebowiei]
MKPSACKNRITNDGEDLEDVKTLIYLGSIIDEQGGSDADVKARIGKARAANLQLRNIWISKQLSTHTKFRIFNTNVKTVLLYGAETWRTMNAIIQKILVFINFVSGEQTLLATTYCAREQTRSNQMYKT